MGRRPRSHQPSSAASLSIGLTTILVAGLAFVDSFNLLVNNPQHGRSSRSSRTSSGTLLSPSPPWGPNLATATRRGRARGSCSASPRSSAPGDTQSSRRTIATAGAGAEQKSTGCVTQRTRTSAAKLSRAAPSVTPTTAPGMGKGEGGDYRRGKGGQGRLEISREGGVEVGRKPQALQQKRRLQRSIGGVAGRSMTRGQLVSSFAMVGAAATLLGASGRASASTEVRCQERKTQRHCTT